MTVSALVSGGKDSLYAAYLADCQGWPVDELVTVRPADPESMLFHTPNLEWVRLQAEAWGRAHRSIAAPTSGPDGELDALASALAGDRGPIVTGAIASSYQWSRLLRLADQVGRRLYAPLWRVDPERVVRAEIAAGLDIRLVHLAAERLDPAWAGERLTDGLLDELVRRSEQGRRLNVAGEGGEYETLVVDAPFFRARIEIDTARTTAAASTTRYDISNAHLKRKER